MGNSNTVLAAETNQPITPPPPPIGTQSPVDTPTSQSVISPVSNNPGVFEDLHKKCKGKNSLETILTFPIFLSKLGNEKTVLSKQ